MAKGFRLITNNYWGDGGGRYLFGKAPDVIVRADGSISPIHSGGHVDGFEATVGKTLLYAYYGGIIHRAQLALDANGTSLVGYGYTGSANSQNRSIQEITLGFNQTIWKDAKWGAVNYMMQYQYLSSESLVRRYRATLARTTTRSISISATPFPAHRPPPDKRGGTAQHHGCSGFVTQPEPRCNVSVRT